MAEHFSKPGGHEVVENGVDGRAQVEADARDDMDVLEDLEVLLRGCVDVAPHQAVHVEGSPTETKHNHQHTWTQGTNCINWFDMLTTGKQNHTHNHDVNPITSM